PNIHPDPSAMSLQILRTCSDAAITATHLMLVLTRADACSFPFEFYRIICRVHIYAAEVADDEVRKRNRAAVLRAWRILKMRVMKEYTMEKDIAAEFSTILTNAVNNLGISKKEEGEVFGAEEEKWFAPVKIPGVGW